MKKILFIVFLSALSVSANAQLTTPAFPGVVFNLVSGGTGTTPASYESVNGVYPKFYLNRYGPMGGYGTSWNITRIPTLNSNPLTISNSSYSTSIFPPCNDFWTSGGQILFSGTGCQQLPISTIGNSSTTQTVNGVIYPVFTSNQILLIPNPVPGQTVYDISHGYLRTWNGTVWTP